MVANPVEVSNEPETKIATTQKIDGILEIHKEWSSIPCPIVDIFRVCTKEKIENDERRLMSKGEHEKKKRRND